jgi:uncharacterized 2Fe-2S/4Fe-4S cluster protein (DUF4445 family)
MSSRSYKVNVVSHSRILSAKKDDRLADIIQQSGIPINLTCNKKGLCGKCFVEILGHQLPPLGEREKFLIKQKNLNKNFRLACSLRINSDLSLNIPEESIMQEITVLTSGLLSSVVLDPAVKKFPLRLKKPEISFSHSVMELIARQLKKEDVYASLQVLRSSTEKLLTRDLVDAAAVIYKDRELVDIEQENIQDKCYGIAIDIGTTTLALELLDLNSGKTIGCSTALNSQVKYGADVISRVSYAYSKPKNLKELQKEVQETLNSSIKFLLKKNQIKSRHVYDVTVAGNTAMNHIFLGIPVCSLALAPYHSVFTSLPELSARDLGLSINPQGKAYISPNIRSFVGGDISAGLLATGLAGKKGIYLYLDLGTNGEIVLKTEKEIITTSTAAGPAFEGMKMSCGMLAFPGAIYKAEYTNRLKTFTIGDKPALGVCGTGIIDLMAVFLEKGKISPNGLILDKRKKIRVKDQIFITQNDVRELQLAIAAIKTGIKMILHEAGLSKDQLDGIYVAGAFGNYLNIRNTKILGLLPRIKNDKIVFIGNASLAGAKTLLLSEPARKTIENLVKKVRFVSLASRPSFQQNFVEALTFSNSFDF